MPEGAVYVGRPSPWGNPFPAKANDAVWMAVALGEHGTQEGKRAAAVKMYRWWMSGADPATFPAATDEPSGSAVEYSDGQIRHMSDIVSGMGMMMWLREPLHIPPRPDLTPLKGRDLVCWCPPDQPCHADVLLELAA